MHNINAGSSSQQELQNENVVNPPNVRNDNPRVEVKNPNLVLVTINVGLEAQKSTSESTNTNI